MNFEVGKKYHNPMSSGYILIHAVFNDHGKEIITYTVHSKSNDKQYGQYWTNHASSHRNKIPYVKTREVIHERWVIWYIAKYTTAVTTLTVTEENYTPHGKVLKREKVTYTETIEE